MKVDVTGKDEWYQGSCEEKHQNQEAKEGKNYLDQREEPKPNVHVLW